MTLPPVTARVQRAATAQPGFGIRDSGREYAHTARGYADFSVEYPRDMLDLKRLRGQHVADIGTGRGRLVYDLRGKRVHTVGVDAVIDPDASLKELGLLGQLSRKTGKARQRLETRIQDFLQHLLPGDARELPLNDGWADTTYHHYSVLCFPDEKPDIKAATLSELVRVTCPEGHIRLFPVRPDEIMDLTRQAGVTGHVEVAAATISLI